MTALLRRIHVTGFALVGALHIPVFAACLEPGGFEVRQCSSSAWFAPTTSDPNAVVTIHFDPNGVATNVHAVFWQIGFGNRLLDTGSGSSGTGISGGASFNGNDSGLASPILLDARSITGDPRVPPDAICLWTTNWADSGIDGCCDNVRDTLLPEADDDLLNPYYNVYYGRQFGYPGFYSLLYQQDYPIGLLLTESTGHYFALAAVASMNRGNDHSGDGPCSSAGGTNPAPCDSRPGFFDLADVHGGLTNDIDPDKSNVVPWQPIPRPLIDSSVPQNPNAPPVNVAFDLSWSEAVFVDDQSSRPSQNPAMGSALGFADGVGVEDVAGRFPLVRYALEVAAAADPNFTAPTKFVECSPRYPALSSPECTSATSAHVVAAAGSCFRVRTLLGKRPQTATRSDTECRVGRCGDLGYEVVSIRTCDGPCHPSIEICDGIDNDCDGTEDDFATVCGEGGCLRHGTCAAGVDDCVAGAPDVEACDGIDNDCNGVIDDGVPGGGQPCGSTDMGACEYGTTRCDGGAIVCAGNVEPAPEVCDGDDDDCDGAVPADEADSDGDGFRICGGDCDDDNAGRHPGKPESCNGLDDDCDGTVDAMGPTTCGAGACLRYGTCVAGIDDCVPGPPSTEQCDGEDNDCDGLIDESDPSGGIPCSTGELGVCAPGATACSSGFLACLPVVPPSAEQCDGLDNDCNGAVDDGDPGEGFSCSTGQPGVCGAGVTSCSGGAVVCSVTHLPTGEVCDGLDNDCDGITDSMATKCGRGPCASTGFCSGGSDTCVPGTPGSETCDGIDNDCDGRVDEHDPATGHPCHTDPPIASGPRFQVSDSQAYRIFPDAAMDADGGFAVVWEREEDDGLVTRSFGRVFDEAGGPRAGEFAVSASSAVNQRSARVAVQPGGDFVVVWDANISTSGFNFRVFGRLFDSTGSPLGGEFQVGSANPSGQTYPSVASDAEGNFVVAWQEYASGAYFKNVLGQRFDSGGTPLSPPFPVSAPSARTQGPALAMNGAGMFVVVWQNHEGVFPRDHLGISGQVYDPSGSPAGGIFEVSTGTSDSPSSPAVAMDGSGAFVVAWDGYGTYGYGREIKARRFGGTASPFGPPFQVNTTSAGSQTEPDVAVDPSGGFVIAWSSYDYGSERSTVFAQQFDAAGARRGTELTPGNPSSVSRHTPSVAMKGSDDFVVVWPGGQSFTSDQLLGQRYTHAGVFSITSPAAGSSVDCSVMAGPRIEWMTGPYDQFKVQISSDPTFTKKKTASNGKAWLSSPAWMPKRKAWKRACRGSSPAMYIRVLGADLDVPKTDPARLRYSPVVSVTPDR